MKTKGLYRFSVILGLMYCFSLSMQAQDTLFYENFQDNSLGQFFGLDLDGLPLSEDFNGFDPAFQAFPISGPNDYRAVGVSSFEDSGAANNWLISSPILISKNNTILSWEAASLRADDDKLESYSVYISTTANTIASFTNEVISISSESAEITERRVDLSAFVGENIFIGFNQIGLDNYALTIDNVLVTEPENENSANLLSIKGQRYQELDNKNFAFEIFNTGAITINKIEIALNINGSNSLRTFENLSIAPSTSTLIPFADLIDVEAKKYDFTASVQVVNEIDQIDPVVVESTHYLTDGGPSQKMVIEEGFGTWCGWCPSGIVFKEIMKFKYPEDVITITVHNDDPMSNIVYDVGLRNLEGFEGYPSAVMNRKGFVAVDQMDTYYQNNTGGFAPLSINIDQAYNPLTRNLKVDVSSTAFTTIEEAIHRYVLIIKEDNVTGLGPEYDQFNNFSSESSDLPLTGVDGVNWQDLPNPVPASDMIYNDVARDIVTGFDGAFNSTTNSEFGDNINFEFEYNLPSTFDENNINIIVLALDAETGEIVNAEEVKMDLESSTANPLLAYDINLYPNPSQGLAFLSVNLDILKTIDFKLLNNFGQIVRDFKVKSTVGENLIRIEKHDLPEGVYNCHLTIDNQLVVKKLIFL